MSFVNPTTPNEADFATFVYGDMQVPAGALPADSPALTRAFYRGRGLTICVPTVSPYDYVNAVYNCAGHILICTAPDQPPGAEVPAPPFFATARAGFGTDGFVAGVVTGAGDNGTSDSLLVPDFFAGITLSDLGFLKTPWGRAYLEYSQDFGGVWGLS